MPDRLNRLKNADFTLGAQRPRGWEWVADSEAIAWSFADEDGGDGRNVVITSEDPTACGGFVQRVRCKPEHWYRIEVVVTCTCDAPADGGGVELRVRPETDDANDEVRLGIVTQSIGPVTMRSYYRTPAGVKAFSLGVGMSGATGSVTLHSALVMVNIDPDVKSHPLALTPPSHAYPAPRRVRRICVCDDVVRDRPLVALLRKRFGKSSVEHVKRTQLRVDDLQADALLIAAAQPPPGVRSLAALERVASQRLVIISMDAFAKVAACGLTIRTVEQADDPLCAKIVWADYMTRGFALHDVIPWASTASDARVYRQRQFKRGAALNKLCRERGYEHVLLAETDSEATSGHPICLYKPIDGGGILVIDCDPIETLETTFGEPNLAAFLLLNMLCVDQVSLGQFVAPEHTEDAWYRVLTEFAERYPAAKLSGRDRHEMMMEVGCDENNLGLPTKNRPMILIRSGLSGDDVAGVYGAMSFLKQLVRNEPYASPYARDLISRHRLTWIPLCEPWQPRHTTPSLAHHATEIHGEFEPGTIAAVIDITDSPRRTLRIAYGRKDANVTRHAQLLERLSKQFSAGRYFYRCGNKGEPLANRESAAWRIESLVPTVEVDADAFPTDLHRAASAAGATLIRIEVPGSVDDFICNSIWRTDLAATTLEHVVGAIYGVLAVNRSARRIAFGDRAPIAPGEAIIEPMQPRDSVTKRRVG